jgi:preprotein translocase subunit SecF
VLTIAGYSINDTVVIFDRVRENLRKYKKLPLPELLNKSLNQTLTRTLLTSITTLLALFALFFFGGQVIRGFTAGLIWGVAIGTYSSIGLAVPLLLHMNLRGVLGGAQAGGAKAGDAKAEIEDQSETKTGEVTPAG